MAASIRLSLVGMILLLAGLPARGEGVPRSKITKAGKASTAW